MKCFISAVFHLHLPYYLYCDTNINDIDFVIAEILRYEYWACHFQAGASATDLQFNRLKLLLFIELSSFNINKRLNTHV